MTIAMTDPEPSRAITDAVLSARFKAVSGREDRAAGLIFRVQDKNNYYILRANALREQCQHLYVHAGTAPPPQGRLDAGAVRAVAGIARRGHRPSYPRVS